MVGSLCWAACHAGAEEMLGGLGEARGRVGEVGQQDERALVECCGLGVFACMYVCVCVCLLFMCVFCNFHEKDERRERKAQ